MNIQKYSLILKIKTMDDLIKEIAENKDLFIKGLISIMMLVLNPSIRYLTKKMVRKTGVLYGKSEARMMQVNKLLSMSINSSCFLILLVIWGVSLQSLMVVFSTLFTIIGVAMFAQWSLLSNITSGIIIFFSMPFRVGDEIEIMDKDMPVIGVVENIMTFTIHIRTNDGALVILANTLFMQRTLRIRNRENTQFYGSEEN